MKTKYEFDFGCKTMFLVKPQEIKFFASDQSKGQSAPEFEVLILLEPKKKFKGEVDGILYITLPGNNEQTKDLANFISHDLQQLLSFFYPDFKFTGIAVGWFELIPETEEEANELGDGRSGGKFRFVEDPGAPEFNSKLLKLFPMFGEYRRLIHQYNAARASTNPVDRFLGMFKVIEAQFCRGRNLEKQLIKNAAFRRLLLTTITTEKGTESVPITEDDIPDVVKRFVRLRDQCSHLQIKTGYSPFDAEVFKSVRPYGRLLEDLAGKSIFESLKAKRPDLFEPPQ